jgi:hypothetical protein
VEKKRRKRNLDQVTRFQRFPQDAIEPEIILLPDKRNKEEIYI